VLDHHKTGFEMFERPAEGKASFDIDNCSINLDMDRSGATMALEYWQPHGLSDTQRQLFLYVEDGDLWRWKMPQSKEFYAGVPSLLYSLTAHLHNVPSDHIHATVSSSHICSEYTCNSRAYVQVCRVDRPQT
jgi:oligoribonuclease NrnB/cAMP/cGMP phosphodiesterase (DHH superfamily)